MDDFGVFGKLADFAGHTVAESGADGKQDIAVADGSISGIAAVHTDISDIIGMIRIQGAFSHDGGYDGNMGFFHKFGKFFMGMGNIDATAD